MFERDTGISEEELANTSPETRDRIRDRYNRVKTLELLTNIQLFNRSSNYLRQKARAVRKKQGLDMPAESEDEIVLGNKTTNVGLVPAALVAVAIAALIAALWMMSRKPTTEPDPAPPNPPAIESNINPGFGTPREVNPNGAAAKP